MWSYEFDVLMASVSLFHMGIALPLQWNISFYCEWEYQKLANKDLPLFKQYVSIATSDYSPVIEFVFVASENGEL